MGQKNPFSFFRSLCLQIGSLVNSSFDIENVSSKSSVDKYISICVGSTPSGRGLSKSSSFGYVVLARRASSLSTNKVWSDFLPSYWNKEDIF